MKICLVVLIAAASASAQIAVDTFPMSSAITPDKKFLLVLNGGLNPPSVSVIDIASAKELSRNPVPDGWLGLAITKAGDRVYVGGGSRAAVYEFTLANGVLKPSRLFPIVADKDRKPEDFIGDVKLSPDGHLLYAADLFRDSVVVVNPQSGLVISRFRTGRRPYRILFHPSGKSVYVSSWADGSVGQYDANTGNLIAKTLIAPHLTDMVWRDGDVEGHPEVKARVFVSASNTNSVYALGASELGELSVLETINLALGPGRPLGMTPSGLGLSADGNRLFVACSDARVAAVVDISEARSTVPGFVATGLYPTAAFGLPDGRMGVLNGSGTVQFSDASAAGPLPDLARADLRPNTGPIKHVLYIVGAIALEKSAPAFVRLDHFHLNSEVDPDSWAFAGMASDYAERLWPNTRAGRRKKDDFEGQEVADAPPAGYLWGNASQAGISLRSYGVFVDNLPKADEDGVQLSAVHDPVLTRVTNPKFRGFDAGYPDVERAKVFLEDLQGFEKAGAMPQLMLMKMGAADGDQAVGMMAEAVAKSRFGNETAIFVVGGKGAWMASPLLKAGSVDSGVYNQSSVLRTVEMILGMRPLTAYDAGAAPLYSVFGGRQ